MFMIEFNCNKCNVINLMIVVGMLKLNCMINGLVTQQMCLQTWYDAQYAD
jgi:hypothetical protein